jgi:ankyrin repeat protein
MMLEQGLHIMECDQLGRQPLHIAANKGFDKIVQLLLDYRAISDAPDQKGQTPLHIACLSGS